MATKCVGSAARLRAYCAGLYAAVLNTLRDYSLGRVPRVSDAEGAAVSMKVRAFCESAGRALNVCDMADLPERRARTHRTRHSLPGGQQVRAGAGTPLCPRWLEESDPPAPPPAGRQFVTSTVRRAVTTPALFRSSWKNTPTRKSRARRPLTS
jgi:hypothetical protein